MTLYPIWDEVFLVWAPGGDGENGESHAVSSGSDGQSLGGEVGTRGAEKVPPWSARFEVWDHDARGGGDYLGESHADLLFHNSQPSEHTLVVQTS